MRACVGRCFPRHHLCATGEEKQPGEVHIPFRDIATRVHSDTEWLVPSNTAGKGVIGCLLGRRPLGTCRPCRARHRIVHGSGCVSGAVADYSGVDGPRFLVSLKPCGLQRKNRNVLSKGSLRPARCPLMNLTDRQALRERLSCIILALEIPVHHLVLSPWRTHTW